MVLRAWWAVLGPAALVAAIALLRGDHGSDLGVVAVVLGASGLGHAVRPGARRGTPAQSLAQVLLVGVAAVAGAGLAGLAFLVVVFSGVCGADCSADGPSAGGVVAGLVLLAAAGGVVAAATLAWRAVERRRTASSGTPRPLLLAPGAAVAVVLVGLAVAASADDRRRPAVPARVLATTPCTPVIRAAPCTPALRLAAAGSGDRVLVVWRRGDRIEGALAARRGPVRRLAVATGLPRAVRDEDGAAVAVAAAPGGGFVVAWAVGAGPRIGVRAVAADGAPGPRAALPSAGRRPVLALASTRAGTVVLASTRTDTPDAVTRVRASSLDARLRRRGGWRTVATGGGVEPLGARADEEGRVRVTRGTFTPGVLLDAAGRPPAAGARTLPAPALPEPDGVPTARRRPSLVESATTASGATVHLWTTTVPRGGGETGVVRQSWTTGPGPARLVAEDLDEPRLATPRDAGVAVVGVRERDAPRGAGDAGRTADVLVGWGP